jgi:ubiquinone/menaquinone biosynthesis C-methylase UbiE
MQIRAHVKSWVPGWIRRSARYAKRASRTESYRAAWDSLASSEDAARHHVGFDAEEASVIQHGAAEAKALIDECDIQSSHRVLEIGCGIARIGREVAPHCGEWVGVDVSRNMLKFAKKRTAHLRNVTYVETNDLSYLQEFPDGVFDVVYALTVFIHLDKEDMFRYILDSYRVLKPGGMFYFNTWDLLSPQGWVEWVKRVEWYTKMVMKPRFREQFSTQAEIGKYVREAGFEIVTMRSGSHLIYVTCSKRPT